MRRGPTAAMLTLLLAGAQARAQAPSFEGVGQAPVAGGDRVRARNRALDEAFRQAIDAAAATLFEPAVLAQKQSALKLTVEPKARSYVTGYRVLEEGEQAGTFRVHLSADLALDRLEHDLGGGGSADGTGSTSKTASGPRLGHCLSEHDAAGASLPPTGGRDRMVTVAGGSGVTLAPLDAACATLRPSATVLAGPDPNAAGRSAKEAKFDGAIVGELAASPAGRIRGTAMIGAHVELRLDLVDAAGRALATARVEGDGFGATLDAAQRSAARAAMDSALDGITRKIAERWPRNPSVTVVLERFERYADLVALQRALAAVHGVISVEPARFAGGAAELSVRGAADTSLLLAALGRAPPSPTAPRFNARALDANTIGVQVVAPPPPPPSLPPPGSPVMPGGAALPVPAPGAGAPPVSP